MVKTSLSFLTALMTITMGIISGRKIAMTEFSIQGYTESKSTHEKGKLDQCLLQCEKHSGCNTAETNSEGTCGLLSSSARGAVGPGQQIFLKVKGSCSEADESGIYSVRLQGEGYRTASVYCQVDSKGKWTVFQRRQDGSVDFYRDWASYKSGFGDLSGEFWLGNDIIHQLTAGGQQTLRVDMESKSGTKYTVYYRRFIVAGEDDKYRISLSGFVGSSPPGDSFLSYNVIDGMQYSTYDSVNNGRGPDYNCAKSWTGAWWYNACHSANPNGRYGVNSAGGIVWYTWMYYSESLTYISLMVGNNQKTND